MNFILDWSPHGMHAPFFLAAEKGWFKEAGLDVTFQDGRGSASTVNLVGAGHGLTLVPALSARPSWEADPGVICRPLDAASASRLVRLVYRAGFPRATVRPPPDAPSSPDWRK